MKLSPLDLDAAVDRDATIALRPVLLATALGMIVEGTSHFLADVEPGHRAWAPLGFAFLLLMLAWGRDRLPGRPSTWLLAPWLAIYLSTLQHVDSAPSLTLTVSGGSVVAIGALLLPPAPFLIAWLVSLLSAGALAVALGTPGALVALALLGFMGAALRFLRLRALEATLQSRLLERSLDQQASEMVRLKGLADMAAGIAHHGNNRLVGIVGSASLLASRISPKDPLWPEVQLIEAAGRELADLIAPLERFAALRDASGTTRHAARRTRPDELVDLPRLRTQLPPGTELALEVEAGLRTVTVDPEWFYSGLVELVKNAAEALAAAQAPDPCVRIRVFRSPDARALVVSVIDDGEGLDPDQAEYLTTPFTTSREPSRKGLGLAVALSAAHLNEGVLRFRRTNGETHVSFELPFDVDESGAPAGGQAVPDAERLRAER